MSPHDTSIVSDHQSETSRTARRGRPPFPRELVLAAADALFSDAAAPQTVSMDDVAAAAGIGKGTLFRAFGNRDGLLDALFALRFAPLRQAVESGPAPLGPAAPPRQRALALLDAGLTFKLENRHLVRARETDGAALLGSQTYRWTHDTLHAIIEAAGARADDAGFTAHVLLGGLRPEVLDAQLAAGRSVADIRRGVAVLAGAAIDAVAVA